MFWRWHRRLGLTALLLVMILAITGVMLNHTDALMLNHTPLHNALILKRYGIEPHTITSFQLGDTWYSDTGNGTISHNDKPLSRCDGSLVGVVHQKTSMHVIACTNELLLLSLTGELIERIGNTYGLPHPITQLGLCGERLCINTPNGIYHLNLQQLQWQLSPNASTNWSTPSTLPAHLKTSLEAEVLGSDLNWERVILDVHSGRLFGAVGVLVMDTAALLLVLLGISGFWLWWKNPVRHQQRSK